MKKENYMLKEDLLHFGVDTINIRVELIDKRSIKTIDAYDFISYMQGNDKETELKRTITIKPTIFKRSTNYLKKYINQSEIDNLQQPSVTNLLKIIDILRNDPKIDKINQVGRIDFAFDFKKDYQDTLNMHKILLLCHNHKKIISKNDDRDYNNNIIKTEGYLSSDKKNKRSILKKRGIIEICAYNKEKQLEEYNKNSKYYDLKYGHYKGNVNTRLEYRFMRHNFNHSKSNRDIIEHQLKKLENIFLADRKKFFDVEKELSKAIIKNYNDSNFKEGQTKLGNFLKTYSQDILTRKILVDLYNNSELNGKLKNYFKGLKKRNYNKHPFIFVSNNQLIEYTKLLKSTIDNYSK